MPSMTDVPHVDFYALPVYAIPQVQLYNLNTFPCTCDMHGIKTMDQGMFQECGPWSSWVKLAFCGDPHDGRTEFRDKLVVAFVQSILCTLTCGEAPKFPSLMFSRSSTC